MATGQRATQLTRRLPPFSSPCVKVLFFYRASSPLLFSSPLPASSSPYLRHLGCCHLAQAQHFPLSCLPFGASFTFRLAARLSAPASVHMAPCSHCHPESTQWGRSRRRRRPLRNKTRGWTHALRTATTRRASGTVPALVTGGEATRSPITACSTLRSAAAEQSAQPALIRGTTSCPGCVQQHYRSWRSRTG